MFAATANASRRYIPDENRFIGVSRNRSTPEKSTMSSNSTGHPLRHAVDDGAQEHVLPPGQLGVEPRPDLEQRLDPPPHPAHALGRLGDAGEDLQQRALARTVAADQRDASLLVDGEVDVSQGPDLVSPSSPAGPQALQPRSHRLGQAIRARRDPRRAGSASRPPPPRSRRRCDMSDHVPNGRSALRKYRSPQARRRPVVATDTRIGSPGHGPSSTLHGRAPSSPATGLT